MVQGENDISKEEKGRLMGIARRRANGGIAGNRKKVNRHAKCHWKQFFLEFFFFIMRISQL